MASFHQRPRAMSAHGVDQHHLRGQYLPHDQPFPRSMPVHNIGHQLRSESRSGYHRLGDQRLPPQPINIQRPLSAMQHRPYNSTYQSNNFYQTYDNFDSDDDDEERCRPRGSTIGDFDLDHSRGYRQPNLFGGSNMYGYGMGPLSASPREQMLRAQMMRRDLYSMDPMMGHMDPMMGRMGLMNGGYGMYPGGSAYGGFGTGSMYGGLYGPGMMGARPPMVGMAAPLMGMGMYGRPYLPRMGGLVDSHSPCLTRAKSWSAYGRLL